MYTTRIPGAVCASLLAFVSSTSHAAPVSGQGTWETTLQGRDLDNNPATFEAYYDTDLNITWLANANVAGDVFKNLPETNTLVAGLDINGVTGWRLPIINPGHSADTPSTIGDLDSEFGHMYFVTLGNLGFCDPNFPRTSTGCIEQPGWGLSNTGPFSNLLAEYYWFDTELVVNPDDQWCFSFNNGTLAAAER
jgi:hypothetical protein